MLDLRHAHGAQRELLQMRQLRKYERMLLGTELPGGIKSGMVKGTTVQPFGTIRKRNKFTIPGPKQMISKSANGFATLVSTAELFSF